MHNLIYLACLQAARSMPEKAFRKMSCFYSNWQEQREIDRQLDERMRDDAT